MTKSEFSKSLIVTLSLLLAGIPHALATQIEVKGLFSGAAVLVIDGREQLLKKGQTSTEGIKLLSADSSQAVVLIDGEQKTLMLSQRINASFAQSEKGQVHIPVNDRRQYLTTGSINGRPVKYLVDTGANVIALSSSTARRLGIGLHEGTRTSVTTASSTAQATSVFLKEVQVGEIRRSNVRAVVIDGDYPRDILLGMSFLQHVDISENGGLMVLTAKF